MRAAAAGAYTIQSTVYGVALFSLIVQTPLLPKLAAPGRISKRHTGG